MYKFKDIPRRFLPCSYFEFITIDQQRNIQPVVDVLRLNNANYKITHVFAPCICMGLLSMPIPFLVLLAPSNNSFRTYFPRPVYMHVKCIIHRSFDVKQRSKHPICTCTLMYNSLIFFYNKGRYVPYHPIM